METGATQQSDVMDLEKLAAIPTLWFPKVNYAGDKLAFYWDKTGRIELYIMDLETKSFEQVSNGELPKTLRAAYHWSRDDQEIVFTKDLDGNEQHDLYSFNLTTRSVIQLTNTPENQDSIAGSSPDGEWYSMLSNRHGQQNLYRMKSDGSEVFQLTVHENPVWAGGAYSPDGQYIIYVANEENDINNFDIYVSKSDGSDIKRIVQAKLGSQDFFSSWSEDSKSIAFTTDKSGTNQAGIANLETGELSFLGTNEYNETAAQLTKDGKYLICLVNHEGSIYPVSYDLKSGERKEIAFPVGSVDLLSVIEGLQLVNDQYLYIGVNSPEMPSSLIKVDILGDSYETIFETDTGEVDASKFVSNDHIWYKSQDGTPIPAIIYKPRGFDPAQKYPAIIMPHGGPTWQYFRNFSIFAQFITNLGYLLMFPNVRGSTGYGVEFRDACRMDWGGKDHEDWVAGRQWLIDNVSADPDRIGVFGGSYGGYAALVCATKSPELWKAVCSWIPISHLGNMYKLSKPHFQWFLRHQMGDPVKNKELWEERSPLNYVANITAPLLLVHGKNDPRCPVEESRNVRDRLLELGKTEGPDGDFEYVEFQDEGHGSSSDVAGRTRTFKLVASFFKKHL